MSLYVPPLFPAEVIDKGGQVFNVKAYGAKGDGVTDDTAAIQAAINAANSAGGGIVFFPPGIYITDTGCSVPNNQNWFLIVGSGQGSTIIKASSSSFSATAVFTFQANGFIFDLTFNGNGATTEALEFSNPSGQSSFTLIQGAARVTAQNALGSWVMVVWDRNQTYQISRFYFDNVTISGPSTTGGDAFAVSYVDECFVRSMTFSGLSRTPNFYVIKALEIDGIFSDGAASTGSLVIDANVDFCNAAGIQVVTTSARAASVRVNSPMARFTGCFTSNYAGNGFYLNPSGSVGIPDITFENCTIQGSGIQVAQALAGLTVIGSTVVNTGDSAIVDGSPASAVQGPFILQACKLNGTNSSEPIFRSSNAVTWSLRMDNCWTENFSSAAFTNITLSSSRISGTKGYNPTGPQTAPAIPASGTALTNPFPFDATVYLSGGTVSAVAVGGASTGLTSGMFFVPAGESITLTYTAAPTWVWVGN